MLRSLRKRSPRRCSSERSRISGLVSVRRFALPILVAGSATLVHSLIENDLVDELRLMVFPVMIGGGKRPFPESRQEKTFKPTGTQAFDSGVAVHIYEPV